MSHSALPLFPNYLQTRERARVSARIWKWARTVAVGGALVYVAILFIAPGTGLTLFWKLTVPILPLIFLVSPGVWRNVCPLAAMNQMPRVFNFSRSLTPPAWLKEYGFVIGVAAFFILAAMRKWLFNDRATATACLILTALGMALVGGYLFKGKSGWCSSICPLYPIQRLYNQTPFAVVPNAHCTTCVGCTKNCYDFNPTVAYLADLYDVDRYHGNYRKFFAAAMPGFVVAYFTLADPKTFEATVAMYLAFSLYMAVSMALFFLLDSFVKVSVNKLTAVFAATAINLFYLFGLPKWLSAIANELGTRSPEVVAWVLQGCLLAATIVWIARTYRKEPLYLGQLAQGEETRITPGASQVLKQAAKADKPTVQFMPGELRVVTELGRTVLEIAEANHQRIEAGCRMGSCGADPVVILSGMENLPPVRADEKNTLERLGLGADCRLACMCRVNGPVTVSTNLSDARSGSAYQTAPPIEYDQTIRHVVIVGNGIAGITAADYVRRNHPDCEIHVVGREKHPLYNRMAITRLIYGRSAMNGLYLQPLEWYGERKITEWLNTIVTSIDRATRQVVLATGETLRFDRLVLANGSSSLVPPVPGYDLPGSFVLREAEEAMDIRAYVQNHGCKHAVVSGGGLLALEAAYALHKLGLDVTVLERGQWLLRRQLDERGSFFLERYLRAIGLEVVRQVEIAEVNGEGRVQQATLNDGRNLQCDLLLVAVGMVPNIALGQDAGVDIKRGVLVNSAMQTSDPDIYAAGDVCEFDGQTSGLWTVAVEQARVAAINAVGGQAIYQEMIPVTTLKVVGVDLTSIGRFEAQNESEIVIALEETEDHRYRKLVIAHGRIVGAILLGYPLEAPVIASAVKSELDVRDYLKELQGGRWDVLPNL